MVPMKTRHIPHVADSKGQCVAVCNWHWSRFVTGQVLMVDGGLVMR